LPSVNVIIKGPRESFAGSARSFMQCSATITNGFQVTKGCGGRGKALGVRSCLYLDGWAVSLPLCNRFKLTTNGGAYRNAHYPPHSHSGITTHLILHGELTITYPNDPTAKKETFGPGSRLDVDAQRVHEVWMGDEGCIYVIGE